MHANSADRRSGFRLSGEQQIWPAGAFRKKNNDRSAYLFQLAHRSACNLADAAQPTAHLAPDIRLYSNIHNHRYFSGVFYFLEPDPKSKLTLILAADLSNTGYTGGAFVC
jgi:hypothetical protein